MNEFRVIRAQNKSVSILKEHRIESGLTQQQVADRAGIQLQHYQKFESGARNLRTASFIVACRVLEALDLDIVKYFHEDRIYEEERIFNFEDWNFKKSAMLVDEDIDET